MELLIDQLDYRLDSEWCLFCSYETLILVAGGIGVSPFVAILRDLLHRYQRDQANLPSDVTLIWAVQKSEELHLLDLVSASAICPRYKQLFNLEVHAYVTRESEPPQSPPPNSRILSSLTSVEASKRPMSILVGTGSNFWISASLLASLFGYLLMTVLVSFYVVEPKEKKDLTLDDAPNFGSGLPLWFKGLLNFLNMVSAVVIFGGAVMALWSYFGKTANIVDEGAAQPLLDSDDDGTSLANESGDRLVHPLNTHFGHRPNLKGSHFATEFINYFLVMTLLPSLVSFIYMMGFCRAI